MSGEALGREEFVSEMLEPVAGRFDAAAMSRGGPGMPVEFNWRGRAYVVASLLSAWKSTGKDRGETYLRRHWYSVQTTTGERVTLYCERQARNTKKPKARWWIYTITR